MLDVIIADGIVLDGTGNPGFRAAVAVRDGRVRLLRGRDLPPRRGRSTRRGSSSPRGSSTCTRTAA
jgi:hypothetical protein